MSNPNDKRKRFKAALALAELTAGEFATAHGVTTHHLKLVVAGVRESPRLTTAVDQLIAEQLGEPALAKSA